MNITILCAGKIKEKYFTDAVKEYSKRLSRYIDLKIEEVADEPTPDHASAAMEEKIKAAEGERMLKKIRTDDYVIALAIDGKKFDSVRFSENISTLMLHGESRIIFVIGGSLGLSPMVLNRANEKMSFSDMTFPHQLMRVILLEQIYRAFRIMRHEPYHK